MSTELEKIEGWIANEVKQVGAWITGEEKKVAPAIAIAESVLNSIKTFEESAAGQTVESIIEAVIPASTGLINAFNLQLPKWLADLKLIEITAGESLSQQVGAAVTVIQAAEPDIKSVWLGSLKSLFTTWFGGNLGQPVTIQQSQTLSQITHEKVVV